MAGKEGPFGPKGGIWRTVDAGQTVGQSDNGFKFKEDIYIFGEVQ